VMESLNFFFNVWVPGFGWLGGSHSTLMVGEIGGGALGFESFLLIFSLTFHNNFVFGYFAFF
jgi:hypothetical protein